MKIEDLKVGRVYRAKRPRVVHTLGGSYINDRQILSISPFEDTIQYDSPKVGFGSKYPVISVEKFLKWAAKDITDDLPPAEWEEYKRCKNENRTNTAVKKNLYPVPSRGLWFCLQVEFIFYTRHSKEKTS